MAVKTTVKVKKTKSGVDVLIKSPGYIISPDKKFLEIKKFDLDLQVQVPTSDSSALTKCELACKAEATTCHNRITAELAQLLKTVQECKRKESGGNKKAADEANKEREKALDKIQDFLADSRVGMRKSIAAGLKLQPKQIMTLGRGIFGDKAIRFPKGLFESLAEPEPDAKTTKSVALFEEDAQELASAFDGLSKLRDEVVKGFESWDGAMAKYHEATWSKKDPPNPDPPPTKQAAQAIFKNTAREARLVTQKVNDLTRAVDDQKQELAKFQGELKKFSRTLKSDSGLKEKPKEKKALDAGLTTLENACAQLEKDLSSASETVMTAQKLTTPSSVEDWFDKPRVWRQWVNSLDSRALLHAESVAKRLATDLKNFSKTWKRAWG